MEEKLPSEGTPIVASADDEDVNDESNEDQGHFKSKLGLVLSCLGCVVGTGNIWRFPRIVANNSGGEGCLQFLIAWILFLFIWSIPIILIEYAVGRYTRKSTVRSFRILIGPWSSWCGAWMSVVNTIIGCYYSVVLGWCFYFLFRSIFYKLPETIEESLKTWDAMQDSSWPIFCHFLSILLAGLCISREVSSIELVNKIIIPILLAILVFSFYWALSLKYAEHGIKYLFTLDWEEFKEPRLWVDAASQNAWDTGAGVGLFLTYATFMTKKNGVVKIGTLLPACNNLISLLCCITTFSTVFSVEMNRDSPKSKEEIVKLLKDNGKANTGLTFIWMPLLYNSIGAAGPFLCALFFICLALAGLSSLISIVELAVHTLQDMEVPRRYAIPISVTVMFCGGLASALDLDILVNQDFVWSFALIIAGSMTLSIPIRYGASRFRDTVVNKFGYDDWNLPFLWQIIVKYIAPLEALGLIIWWIIDTVNSEKDKDGLHWYELDKESFMMAILQDKCTRVSCLNGGTCESNGCFDFRCICPQGFTGHLCEEKTSIAGSSKSSSCKWAKINPTPVCFGTRNSSFGRFYVKQPAAVTSFKLVHLSGFFTCDVNDQSSRSFWGCAAYQSHSDKLLTIITNNLNQRILPQNEFITNLLHLEYTIPQVTSLSSELSYQNFAIPMIVTAGQEFRIWYGPDLQDNGEENSGGTADVDVYVCIASII